MIMIALGSNVGDAAQMLRDALEAMPAHGIHVQAASRVFTTPAMLPPGAPPAWDVAFKNQVVRVETALAPRALLAALKTIEQQLGRQDRGRWGPREIDLDLLCHGDAVIADATLQLPHPGIAQRRFVLEPMAEIAGDWVHPVNQKTVQAMLAELPV